MGPHCGSSTQTRAPRRRPRAKAFSPGRGFRMNRLVTALAAVLLLAAPARCPADYLGGLGGSLTIANSINNAGQVVGMSALPSGDFHAFLYSGGKTTDLGTLGGTNSTA